MVDIPDNAPAPRLCHIVKWPDFDGYGFNLHADKNHPGQYIGKVDADSPAEMSGLKECDRIIEVNGVNILNENHKQVVQRIKAIENETRLLVIDRDADQWYKSHNIVVSGSLPNVVSASSVRVPKENSTASDTPPETPSDTTPVGTNGHATPEGDDDRSVASGASSQESEASTQPQPPSDDLPPTSLLKKPSDVEQEPQENVTNEGDKEQVSIVEKGSLKDEEKESNNFEKECDQEFVGSQKEKGGDSSDSPKEETICDENKESEDGDEESTPIYDNYAFATEATEKAALSKNANEGEPVVQDQSADMTYQPSKESETDSSVQCDSKENEEESLKESMVSQEEPLKDANTEKKFSEQDECEKECNITNENLKENSQNLEVSDSVTSQEEKLPKRKDSVASSSSDVKEPAAGNVEEKVSSSSTSEDPAPGSDEVKVSSSSASEDPTPGNDEEKQSPMSVTPTTTPTPPPAETITQTPAPVTKTTPPDTPPATKTKLDKSGLNLNMTAAEMRAYLASKKKVDPRKDTMDLKKKYQIIQNM